MSYLNDDEFLVDQRANEYDKNYLDAFKFTAHQILFSFARKYNALIEIKALDEKGLEASVRTYAGSLDKNKTEPLTEVIIRPIQTSIIFQYTKHINSVQGSLPKAFGALETIARMVQHHGYQISVKDTESKQRPNKIVISAFKPLDTINIQLIKTVDDILQEIG